MRFHPFLCYFRDHVRRRPGAPALVWRGEAITYAELDALAREQSGVLAGLGLRPQDAVGISAAKSPQAIALLLACMEMRLRFCVPSAELPGAIKAELYERAGCRHVLTAGEPAKPAGHEPRGEADPGDVTFILTTSGSTGVPKLVPLTAGATGAFAEWAAGRFEIAPGTRVLSYAPLNFDLSLLDIWTTLRQGGCAVLVPPENAVDGRRLSRLIAEHEVAVVQAVPMMFHLLARAAGDEPLPAVRHAVFTGDTAPPQVLAAAARLFPEARLYNLYGCTETNDSLLHEIDRDHLPEGPLPLGRPLPGVRVRLVRPDSGLLTGPGVGELHVSTPFQSPGYLGGVEPGRFTGDGFFRSGDLVRRHADGTLTLEGRTDHHVKVRGLRVNTAEVERVLGRHDQVAEAAVVALPDPAAGHVLHAFIRRSGPLTSLDLRAHCAALLPPGAVPTVISIVEEALPRTSTGKIDRNHLKKARQQ
ncbi:AMP-binding protein [Spongiactinospora sp. 9N601]|uniref:AMP-binding protein n=1 Tax=Spongiactinospora sp. 9N601 TaxID=3375149 RepID=UPI0037ABC09A